MIRLKRFTRLRLLRPPVISSGRRWLEQGYFATTRRHWWALARHLAERAFHPPLAGPWGNCEDGALRQGRVVHPPRPTFGMMPPL